MSTLACYIAGLCDHPRRIGAGRAGFNALHRAELEAGEDHARLCRGDAQAVADPAAADRKPHGGYVGAQQQHQHRGKVSELSQPSRPNLHRRDCRRSCILVGREQRLLEPRQRDHRCRSPGLATTGGPLIVASSPYARKGVLWDVYKRHFGPDGDPLILVAQAPSRTLNPSLPQRVVDRALEEDRAKNTAEYSPSSVPTSSCSCRSRSWTRASGDYREQPSMPDACMRPSSIRHWRLLRLASRSRSRTGTPTRSSSTAVASACLRSLPRASSPSSRRWSCSTASPTAYADRYGGEFPSDLFAKHGIIFELCRVDGERPVPGTAASAEQRELYAPRTIASSRSSRPSRANVARRQGPISHPPNGHDDVANVVAGVASRAAGSGFDETLSWVDGPGEPVRDWHAMRAQRLRDHLRQYGVSVASGPIGCAGFYCLRRFASSFSSVSACLPPM